MRYLISLLACVFVSTSAYAAGPTPHDEIFTPAPELFASGADPAPAPEMGLGLAGLVMVAGAAYLAARRRR